MLLWWCKLSEILSRILKPQQCFPNFSKWERKPFNLLEKMKKYIPNAVVIWTLIWFVTYGHKQYRAADGSTGIRRSIDPPIYNLFSLSSSTSDTKRHIQLLFLSLSSCSFVLKEARSWKLQGIATWVDKAPAFWSGESQVTRTYRERHCGKQTQEVVCELLWRSGSGPKRLT